jgi:hypothetical protein
MLQWVYIVMLVLGAYCFKVALLDRKASTMMFILSAIILVPVTFNSYGVVAVSQGTRVMVEMPEMFLFGLAGILINASFAILEITGKMPDIRKTFTDGYESLPQR